ncbi:MAG: GNAT family N-acetyltransferase [Paludibacter sp.]|jgi:diamine N-acetyltransferase|nr:GNAT family N-acetyltransferase [Paludibacter sp.]
MFNNENIQLRAVEPEDLKYLYDWENRGELWNVGVTRQPYSRFELKQYIATVGQEDIYAKLQLRLMIDTVENRQTIGTIDLFDFDIHNSRISLGVFIVPECQKKSFSIQAIELAEEYVFKFLKINQIYCFVPENNTASRRMLEKAGYTDNAILKNWLKYSEGYENVIVYQHFAAQ